MFSKSKWMGKKAGLLPVMIIAAMLMTACGGTSTTSTTVPSTSVPTAMTAPTAMEPTAMATTAMEPTVMATAMATSMATAGGGMMQDTTVQMKEQNASGENGTATIKHTDTGMVVMIDLSNGTTDPQPAHIHKGTCANLDPNPAVALNSVVNGKSETTISTSDFTMETGQAYAINVHKSVTEVSTYVSCGDITDSGMMGSETPVMMSTPGMMESTPGMMSETPGAMMETTPVVTP